VGGGDAATVVRVEDRAEDAWGVERAGTDFIIVRDGRIAALYLFFDKLP
jgi:hypothetical protein